MMDTSLRTCRVCGCWDLEPCVDPATGLACSWVSLDLCSVHVPIDEVEGMDFPPHLENGPLGADY